MWLFILYGKTNVQKINLNFQLFISFLRTKYKQTFNILFILPSTWYFMKTSAALFSLFFAINILPAQEVLFANQQHNFEIMYPSSWQSAEYVSQEVPFNVWNPIKNEKDFRETVNIMVVKTKTSDLETCYNTSLMMMEEMMKDQQIRFDKMGNTIINDFKSYWATYTTVQIKKKGIFKKKEVSKSKVYFIVRDRKQFMITCTALESEFSAFESEFDEIAKSFVFIERTNI